MYVIAAFKQNLTLELALSALLEAGIPKDQVMAVPLKQRSHSPRLFDTMHKTDGISSLDTAAVLGTCFMLLGAIYGFELEWGPILWGIIGAVSGILLGLAIKLIRFKRLEHNKDGLTAEVVLIISAPKEQISAIEQLLWHHKAIGISNISAGQLDMQH